MTELRQNEIVRRGKKVYIHTHTFAWYGQYFEDRNHVNVAQLYRLVRNYFRKFLLAKMSSRQRAKSPPLFLVFLHWYIMNREVFDRLRVHCQEDSLRVWQHLRLSLGKKINRLQWSALMCFEVWPVYISDWEWYREWGGLCWQHECFPVGSGTTLLHIL